MYPPRIVASGFRRRQTTTRSAHCASDRSIPDQLRQGTPERSALPHSGFHANLAAVALDDRPRDVQPKAKIGAWVAAALGPGRSTIEGVEDAGQVVRSDTWPFVAHLYPDAAPGSPPQGERDGALRRRVRGGVGEQMGKRHLDARSVRAC